MRSLERFWQWFDAEEPLPSLAQNKSAENLSPVAWQALNEAGGMIQNRSGIDGTLWVEYAAVLRDLSLSLCAALERMRAAVPEKPPEPRSVWATQAEVNMVLANSTYAVPPAPPARWWSQDEVFMANYGVPPMHMGHAAPPDCEAIMFVNDGMHVGDYPHPPPKATPFGDGTNCADVMCKCREFIVRPAVMYVSPSGTHTQNSCLPMQDC